jgi:hypothetical protein
MKLSSKKKKVMKNLFVLVASVLFLSSCGYSTPMIGSVKEPFVVRSIEVFDSDTFVKYIGYTPSTRTLTLEEGKCAFVGPVGLYNVGDTVYLSTTKK